ncbi:MAG TPA: branched-chain amino acid aminotransferase [Chitinophagaceae bacterium]|nr:branched-chain amino acid aminotransferase [Chitinophagaceae bacterium]
MELLTDIHVRRTTHSRIREVDFNELEFGKYTSDHMLVCDYQDEEWKQPQIVPFANLSLNPATLALHYGQTVFEGMKAFRMENGGINIFRIERHYERFTKSLERMCMAIPPREVFTEGLIRLVETDKDWVPQTPGAALYLRPFVYASEAKFGIKVSSQYRFVIFTGPVSEIYFSPIRIKVETKYTRASKGGTGYTKCGGNYGAALYPTQLAREEGYDQVLWTEPGDGSRNIQESGMMNILFVIDNILVTPSLSDSVLDGITRESILILAGEMGYKIEERPVSIDELENAFRQGSITEAFGAGTAAVVAPIKTININSIDYHLPQYSQESLLSRIKTKLDRIRKGLDEDIHEWNYVL